MTQISERVASMAVTSTGLRIGISHIPRQIYSASRDQALTQKALLDKRTAQPLPAIYRFIAPLWRFL